MQFNANNFKIAKIRSHFSCDFPLTLISPFMSSLNSHIQGAAVHKFMKHKLCMYAVRPLFIYILYRNPKMHILHCQKA